MAIHINVVRGSLPLMVDIRPPYRAGIERAQLGIIEQPYPERNGVIPFS
jgi:hypothetical protein